MKTCSVLVVLPQFAAAVMISLDMSSLPSAQGWTYSATGTSHGGQVESTIWSTNGAVLSMNTMSLALVSPASNVYLQSNVLNTTHPITVSKRL